ncbi:MAG: ABC transporter permease [Bacteroidetes bacterium]|nr:ABC transporter permease [Bacteroidota bacterium]
MRFEKMMAIKYTRPAKDNLFVTMIGLISVAGVTIGVAAIVIVLSMLNGFENEVKKRFIGFDAHLKVRRLHEEPVEQWPQLVHELTSGRRDLSASPYVLQKAMISGPNGNHVGFVKGTLDSSIAAVTDLEKDVVAGRLDFSDQPEGYPGALVGASMAIQLDINPGDTITVISPAGIVSPFDMPTSRRFTVSGIFRTDMFEYDNAYIFVGLNSAQRLFEMGDGITGLDLSTGDIEESFDIQKKLQSHLGEAWTVETWYDQHLDLYSAMKVEKWGSLVVLSLIILVAGFNIISTLIMIVMQKTHEIGILKSMGATNRMISRIFMNQGLLTGSLGMVAGCFIGYSVCFAQMHFGFVKLPADIFFLDALPVQVQLVDFIAIVVVAFVLCLFSTVYPARKAASLEPVDALRK